MGAVVLPRPFKMFCRILNTLMYLWSECRFRFRHIQTYLSITPEYIHTYSEPSLSLAYSETWYGIFKSSTVYRSLSDILYCHGKIVPGYNYFPRSLLLRLFHQNFMYLSVLLSLYSYIKFCFRHIQTYSSIIQEHTHVYLEPSVSLTYSEPWHIHITKDIPNPHCIHYTILNIFINAPSWTFLIQFWIRLFYRCSLTSTVTLRYL